MEASASHGAPTAGGGWAVASVTGDEPGGWNGQQGGDCKGDRRRTRWVLGSKEAAAMTAAVVAGRGKSQDKGVAGGRAGNEDG